MFRRRSSGRREGHGNERSEDRGGHPHHHGAPDPNVLASEQGVRAVWLSFTGLAATALAQLLAVYLSGSVALFADTVHNFGDATTAIPLWVAFSLAARRPSRRFTYGYGRMEDLAGAAIVLIVLLSAALAGYESIRRLLDPEPVHNLWAVAIAALIGLLGNEAVARFRIRVGREIGSAALVADGYHARADGLTSLSVLLGAVGLWAGIPILDPIVGLLIAGMILRIVWDSGRIVLTRLLDGVEPHLVEQIEDVARETPGVREVGQVRLRWLGHRLHAEVNLSVDPRLSVERGHDVAQEVRHRLLHRLEHLAYTTIHIDPDGSAGEEHHHVPLHSHDDLPPHSHP